MQYAEILRMPEAILIVPCYSVWHMQEYTPHSGYINATPEWVWTPKPPNRFNEIVGKYKYSALAINTWVFRTLGIIQ